MPKARRSDHVGLYATLFTGYSGSARIRKFAGKLYRNGSKNRNKKSFRDLDNESATDMTSSSLQWSHASSSQGNQDAESGCRCGRLRHPIAAFDVYIMQSSVQSSTALAGRTLYTLIVSSWIGVRQFTQVPQIRFNSFSPEFSRYATPKSDLLLQLSLWMTVQEDGKVVSSRLSSGELSAKFFIVATTAAAFPDYLLTETDACIRRNWGWSRHLITLLYGATKYVSMREDIALR